jgi:RNA polymerase sigma factor (sigma-70 family)
MLSRQLQRQRRFLYPDHDPFLPWKDLEGAPQVSKIENHESVIDVADILEQAPDTYAEVLRLHYLEGLPLEEAAEKLGVSGACLRKRHERALKWARKHFAPQT